LLSCLMTRKRPTPSTQPSTQPSTHPSAVRRADEAGGLRPASLTTFRVGTLVLQTAAAARCTLRQIAELMCDPDPGTEPEPHPSAVLWKSSDAADAADANSAAAAADADSADADDFADDADADDADAGDAGDDPSIAMGPPREREPLPTSLAEWTLDGGKGAQPIAGRGPRSIAAAPAAHAALVPSAEHMSPVSVLNRCEGACPAHGAASAWSSHFAILDGDSDEPPTRLQRLCHEARVEALKQTYDATKAMDAPERSSVEERAFLADLCRRLTHYFERIAHPPS